MVWYRGMHWLLEKVKEPELNRCLCKSIIIIRLFLEVSENYFLLDSKTLVWLLLKK